MARLYKKKNIELPHKIDKVDLEPEFGPCTSLKEFASRLNTVPLVLQPGAKFEYSMSTDLGWTNFIAHHVKRGPLPMKNDCLP